MSEGGQSIFANSNFYSVDKNWECNNCIGACFCQRISSTVEVIVVAHNHEKFILQCLESIESQDFSEKLSIVIHDDASTDSTGHLCTKFLRDTSLPVTYLRAHQNRFEHDRFTFFLELFSSSSADYVAFLDGDDYWISRNKISKQVTLLRDNPSAVLCHTRYQVRNEIKHQVTLQPSLDLDTLSSSRSLLRENFVGTLTVLVKTDVAPYEKLASIFGSLKIGDYPIWCALVSKSASNEIIFLDEITARYRIHGKNYWSRKSFLRQVLQARESQIAIQSALGVRIGEASIFFVAKVIARRMKSMFRIQ